MDVNKFVGEVFDAIDNMDADRFVMYLAADAVFRFGNSPAITGTEDIGRVIGQFFRRVKGMRHNVMEIIGHEETIICKGKATYIKKNGSEVTVDFSNVWHMSPEGKIQVYLSFADLRKVFEA